MSKDAGQKPPVSAAKHELLLELGRGGMGVVYLAEAERPSGERELVVVKRLRSDLASDPDFRQMFLEEARLSALLRHPNIVETREVGFDGKNYFLELEYLAGQPFDAVMRDAERRVGLPRPIAIHVILAVLDGLEAAHETRGEGGAPLSLVHRDVSPHNVFVTYDGHVKVLDFGIAKAADSTSRTRTGVVKGKVAYMAPEQAARRPVDRRADIFAVGVMLWQAVHRKRLWGDLAEEEIFMRVRGGDLPAPEDDPDVPPALEAICRRAMAVAPESRFPTAAEFRAALSGWAAESGELSSDAAVSAYLCDAFSAERAGAEEEIATLRAGGAGAPRDVDVPVRGFSTTYRARGMSTTYLSPVKQREKPRRLRWVLGAGVVVASVAAGALVLALRRTPGAATVASAPPGCASSSACVREHGGEAYRCRRSDRTCVPLASQECRVLAEPAALESDDTLWIGTMFPESGPDAEKFGTASARAADLARRDFQELARGIPTDKGDGSSRPLGIVACDDARDRLRAARHLADEVEVPAVIGFHTSVEAIELSSTVFVPKGILTLSALNSAALVTKGLVPEGRPRLVYRTAISTTESGPAWGAIVEQLLEPRVRKTPGAVAKDEEVRVAAIRPSSATGRTITDALVAHLRVNGKSVAESTGAAGGAFRDFAYTQPEGDAPPQYGELVESVTAFRPHIVMLLVDQMTDALIEPIEKRWPASAPFRPLYAVLGTPEGEAFFRFIGNSAERRRRFFGLSTLTSTPANTRFVLRYNEAYSPKVTLADSPAAPYDSVYLVAYAAYAAQTAQKPEDGPLTGERLAGALPRLLPPGKPIDVGVSGMFDAFAALRGGGRIDLGGAFGRLDFDLRTGESTADLAVLCVDVDARGKATESRESGVFYDAGQKKLVGTMKCP